MSYSPQELAAVENAQADFDTAVKAGQWLQARTIIDALGEQGFTKEALYLHDLYQKAYEETPLTYEPHETVIPLWSPAEHRAWDDPVEAGKPERDDRSIQAELSDVADQARPRL